MKKAVGDHTAAVLSSRNSRKLDLESIRLVVSRIDVYCQDIIRESLSYSLNTRDVTSTVIGLMAMICKYNHRESEIKDALVKTILKRDNESEVSPLLINRIDALIGLRNGRDINGEILNIPKLQGLEEKQLKKISATLITEAVNRYTAEFTRIVEEKGVENVDILHPNYRLPKSDLSAQPKTSDSQRRVRFAVDSKDEEKKDPDSSPQLTETSKLFSAGKEAGISADSSK